ncbi:MAG: glycosyltransferase family 25 protein [Bacteroides sp.]|nr:glycosyltransferase family 25 protein [Bacteroides sp.]MCM1447746.1 glycosyltransferase family 25 protein [Bacteroides sp.]
MKITTYIINLKTSSVRKDYMKQLLSTYHDLDPKFIEATDGRILTEDELDACYDRKKSLLRYGRKVNLGEIGCTLSHYRNYQKISEGEKNFVLVMEDDISIVGNLDFLFSERVTSFMHSDEPRILLLSGDYWYWQKKDITRVFSAVGSYAYLINRAAARRIVNGIRTPFHVADDWNLYKDFGVKLYAAHPYIIDANINGISSDIQQEHWGHLKSKMSCDNVLKSYSKGMVKGLLGLCGHFESKIRNE